MISGREILPEKRGESLVDQGFSPGRVRGSGGWRGWREGMGGFPDLAGRGGGGIRRKEGLPPAARQPEPFPVAARQPKAAAPCPRDPPGAGPFVGSGVWNDALLPFRFPDQPRIAHLTFSQALQELPDVTTVLGDDLLLDPANFTDHRIGYPFGCRVGINCLHLQGDLLGCILQAAVRPTRQPSPAGGGGFWDSQYA